MNYFNEYHPFQTRWAAAATLPASASPPPDPAKPRPGQRPPHPAPVVARVSSAHPTPAIGSERLPRPVGRARQAFLWL